MFKKDLKKEEVLVCVMCNCDHSTRARRVQHRLDCWMNISFALNTNVWKRSAAQLIMTIHLRSLHNKASKSMIQNRNNHAGVVVAERNAHTVGGTKMRSPYTVLKLKTSASVTDIKTSFRKVRVFFSLHLL